MAKSQKETMETAEGKVTKTAESRYTKEQILSSATFAGRRDILNVLLTDGEEYTIGKVNRIMDDWLKKEVK